MHSVVFLMDSGSINVQAYFETNYWFRRRNKFKKNLSYKKEIFLGEEMRVCLPCSEKEQMWKVKIGHADSWFQG